MLIKLTIIIPVYNVEKYLRECLESVINQTYKDIEIICINDGSTDSSLEILKEYSKKDNRIKVINKKQHEGVAVARNTGVFYSTCVYITFVDPDDYIALNTYEEALKHVYDADIVEFGVTLFGDLNYKILKADQKYFDLSYKGLKTLNNEIRYNTDVSLCNKIFKRDIIINNNIQFPDGIYYEDTAFYWKYIMFAEKAYFMQDRFYFYRKHSNSIMAHTYNKYNFVKDYIYILKDIYNYWCKIGIFEESVELFTDIFERYFCFSVMYAPKCIKADFLNEAFCLASKIFKEKRIQNSTIKALLQKDFDKALEPHLTFYQRIFSIKNVYVPSIDKKQKYLYFLGIKVPFNI